MTELKHVCGISHFVERDIDMLMAEELRVNSAFAAWIMRQFRPSTELEYPAADTNVSVFEDGSEADVIASFATKSGKPHRLFIENKIDAPLMPDQLERYLRRATNELSRGAISGFSILFFTPSNYRAAKLPEPIKQLSFEEVAKTLGSMGDVRARYRASLLLRAIPATSPQARDARIVESDPYIKEWWDTVYSTLEKNFPGFFVHKTQYPRSVYFAPETSGQARYLRVDFKGHKGEVDLAFKNIPYQALATCTATMRDVPGKIVENGKSSAIQIDGLEPFVISDGLNIIETKVLPAYRATYRLLTFWRDNQEKFDQLAQNPSQ